MTVALRRRTFLVGLGSFAAYSNALAAPEPTIPERQWELLKRMLNGNVLRPNDDAYLKAALPDNLRYKDNLPQGIAQVSDANQVAQCIAWARSNNVHPIMRAGGHSYAGYSTTRGLLIDLKKMRKASYSKQNQTVMIDSGVLNQDVYDFLSANDLFMTHGRCPYVGAAGFLLGGGIGFSMRNLGISSDAMTGTDLVRTDGKLIFGGAGSDLLWATRGGGGGSFGVSTSFTLKVEQAPAKAAVFVLYWTKPDPKELLGRMMPLFQSMPKEFGSKINVFARRNPDPSKPKVLALGQFVASAEYPDPEAALRDKLAPILSGRYEPDSKCAGGTFCGIKTQTYWQAQKTLEEKPAHVFMQEKSLFVRNFDDKAIEAAFDRVYRIPFNTNDDSCFKFFQTGQAVDKLAPGDTAFVHRGSQWLFDIEVNWDCETPNYQIQANLVWQQEFYQKIAGMVANSGSFQNFADPSLRNGEWQRSYYGNNYSRLQRIKRDLDPGNFLQYEQSIRPA